jgi:hypothetical protein
MGKTAIPLITDHHRQQFVDEGYFILERAYQTTICKSCAMHAII